MDNKKLKLSPSCIFNNTLGCIKKVPWILGRYAFFVILLLAVLDILFGILIFYNYISLARTSNPRITESPSTFKVDIYQEIIEDWQIRGQKLQNGEAPSAF